MNSDYLLISASAFVAVVLLGLVVLFHASHHQAQSMFKKRIQNINREFSCGKETITSSFKDHLKNRLMGFLGSLGQRFTNPKTEEQLSRLRQKFLQAGIRKENAPLVFMGVKALGAVSLVIAFSLLKVFSPRVLPPLTFMMGCVLVALMGFYLPTLWLHHKTAGRRERILRGLPDALDLMVVCAEAGVGLDSAINRVGEEMKLNNEPLSEEFKLLGLELRAGKQRRDALANLAVRTDVEDVRSLTSLLVQTERFGTSIAQALRVHSDAMRTLRFQRAEEVAAKLPVKLLFPLIFFIFPSLFVTILGPAMIRIYRTLLPTLAGG